MDEGMNSLDDMQASTHPVALDTSRCFTIDPMPGR